MYMFTYVGCYLTNPEDEMVYRDPLYGEWELPSFLEKIIHTKEMARLRNIAQAVMPNALMPYGTIPSRFHHGLGAAFLAMIVLKNNPALAEYKKIFPVAALLHDAGSPPFSHLSEHFLKEVTGKDGESFLEEMLDGSETERALKSIGVSPKDVVRFVTGKITSYSEILNGSLDVDNLDNVGRYNFAVLSGAPMFDAVKIAAAFQFTSRGWCLFGECYDEAKKWQTSRLLVYRAIYGKPHLNVAAMLYRAVEIAFYAGELWREFFFLDDTRALDYLLFTCNDKTSSLIKRLLRWDWYKEIIAIETTEPSENLKTSASHFTGRRRLAQRISEIFHIPEEKICVYTGRGKDRRRILIPFITAHGKLYHDDIDDRPIWRVKVYLAPEMIDRKNEIMAFVQKELG